MNKIKQSAAKLREVATELERVEQSILPRADEVIRKHSPSNNLVCCDVAVPLHYLGHKDYDARRAMVNDAGRRIGQHIADSLNFELARDPYSFAPGVNLCAERYRAEVHVFTPGELRKLVEAAIRAGAGLTQ